METRDKGTYSCRSSGPLHEPQSGRLGINVALWLACLLIVATGLSLGFAVSMTRASFSIGLRSADLFAVHHPDKRAPFQRFSSTKPNALGLFICHSIVEAHNGTISVTSSPQRAVFTVPLVAASSEERADAA